MARKCTICSHKAVQEVDRAILAGESTRGIARRHGVGADSVQRHKAHISTTLVKAHEATVVTHADSMLEHIQELRDRADRLGAQAETKGDLRAALLAVRELRGIAEFLARLSLEVRGNDAEMIARSPAWAELRSVIIDAIRPCEPCTTRFHAALTERLGESHNPTCPTHPTHPKGPP